MKARQGVEVEPPLVYAECMRRQYTTYAISTLNIGAQQRITFYRL